MNNSIAGQWFIEEILRMQELEEVSYVLDEYKVLYIHPRRCKLYTAMCTPCLGGRALMGKKDAELICAAGGLVWRFTKNQSEILVIHRARYDDWTLPKGKLREDERWEDAAMREVKEETGYRVEIVSFANSLFYYVSGKPKIVLFWNMNVRGKIPKSERMTDSLDEGDLVEWLTLDRALQRITYEDEKELIIKEYERQPVLSAKK